MGDIPVAHNPLRETTEKWDKLVQCSVLELMNESPVCLLGISQDLRGIHWGRAGLSHFPSDGLRPLPTQSMPPVERTGTEVPRPLRAVAPPIGTPLADLRPSLRLVAGPRLQSPRLGWC